jgi:hypothetical protein
LGKGKIVVTKFEIRFACRFLRFSLGHVNFETICLTSEPASEHDRSNEGEALPKPASTAIRVMGEQVKSVRIEAEGQEAIVWTRPVE